MVQRVQTFYLLLVGLGCLLGLVFFAPPLRPLFDDRILDIRQMASGIVFFLSFLLVLWSIFSFKNRQRQFVLNRIVVLLNFGLVGAFVYGSLMVSGGTFVPEKDIKKLIPLFSIVLLVLANKAIKKDEALVKSVDRLR